MSATFAPARVALLGLLSAAAAGQSAPVCERFVETFDEGQNPAGWDWLFVASEQLPVGGNPRAFLRGTRVVMFPGDLFYPTLSTTSPSSAFTGDYRSRGVRSVRFDLAHFQSDPALPVDLHASIELCHDAGTPAQLGDDTCAFFVLDEIIPPVGGEWRSYELEIPSQATELPPGWAFFDVGGPEDWNLLITSVSQVVVRFGSPLEFGEGDWVVGADNLTIISGPREPRSYCQHTPFSTGLPSSITANLGTVSIAAGDLVLVADHLPPAPGLFLAANAPAAAPLHNGFLCVDPASLQRLLPIGLPGPGGEATLQVDFLAGALTPGGSGPVNVIAGTTHYFQRLNRDPGVGSGVNLSNGVAVCIVP